MHQRIIILGGPGTGKNWLGERLSQKSGITHYDTDDILWKQKYTQKRSESEREKRINTIARKDQWIIAGAVKGWLGKAWDRADTIIILQEHFPCVVWRVTKRYIRRFLRGEIRGGIIGGWYKVLKWSYNKFQRPNGESVLFYQELKKRYPTKVQFLDKHGKHAYLAAFD